MSYEDLFDVYSFFVAHVGFNSAGGCCQIKEVWVLNSSITEMNSSSFASFPAFRGRLDAGICGRLICRMLPTSKPFLQLNAQLIVKAALFDVLLKDVWTGNEICSICAAKASLKYRKAKPVMITLITPIRLICRVHEVKQSLLRYSLS